MGEEPGKYKFDNLQPITFLKKFNKMADEDQKHPLVAMKNQLRVFPLSKFPLPSFYEQMEGIFETGTKKKDILNLNTKSRDDIHDEQFLAKHRHFMAKAIEKIIRESQSQQQNLQNYKSQFNREHKASSQPKKTQGKTKLAINTKARSQSTQNENLKDWKMTSQKQGVDKKERAAQQVKDSTYLQKIQLQRFASLRNVKNEKIKMKDSSRVSQFLDSRRNFMSERVGNSTLEQIKTGRSVEYNDVASEDWKKTFIDDILNLQKEQNAYQRHFGARVEDEIKKFSDGIARSVGKSMKQMKQ